MTPDPKALIERALTDRDRRPWNYYRLDHDTTKRLLNEMADALATLQAKRDDLRGVLTTTRQDREQAEASLAAALQAQERMREALTDIQKNCYRAGWGEGWHAAQSSDSAVPHIADAMEASEKWAIDHADELAVLAPPVSGGET